MNFENFEIKFEFSDMHRNYMGLKIIINNCHYKQEKLVSNSDSYEKLVVIIKTHSQTHFFLQCLTTH